MNSGMNMSYIPLENCFSLNKASAIIDDGCIDHDPPEQQYSHTYHSYHFEHVKPPGLRGTLTVTKSAGAQGMSHIEASCEQKTGNYTYRRITRIENRCGGICEPQLWEIETSHDPYLPLAENKATYELAKPEIIRRRGSKKTTIHVGEVNIIHYYSLFCMLQDWDETMSIAFSMIDPTGQIRHGCSLRFNKKIRTIIREDEYTLRRFDLTGEAILPTSFWATTEGKIILVVSGMDILLLGAVI